MLLHDYYNQAVLSVRSARNGIDKLGRIPGESLRDFNKRRQDYIEAQQIRRQTKRDRRIKRG